MASPILSFWKQTPFIRFLLPFVLGIVAGWNVVPLSCFNPWIAIGVFCVVAAGIYLLSGLEGRKLKKYIGAGIFCVLFCFGVLLSWWNNESLRSDFAGRFPGDSSWVKVKLNSELTEKENSWKATVEILAVENNTGIHATRGRAFLYFEKKKQKPGLKYGDVLLIPNHLRSIQNSGSPGALDYKKYCQANHIWFSGYLSSGQWHILKRGQGNALHLFFIKARTACVRILEKYITRSREAGIAEAILLGYKEHLDDQLVQSFANIGVVHLIAISGMHVALIYIVLLWIFRLLPFGKIVKGVLIGICLWGFTLLTGAHPSTLRATVMLSFLIAGKFFFSRPANTFNILAASAFVLLCFDPYLFFDVGFQLSYLAVAGILLFQKPIENLLLFKNKAGNYIWQMMSVSISAQLLTFPLALYYFHQFPSFFLISNLLLIPLVTLVLYGEVLLLLFSFIPPVAAFIGMVITKTLVLTDNAILWAGRFPFIKWDYYGLDLTGMFLLYGCIALVSVWLLYKHKKALIAATTLMAILGLIVVFHKWNMNHQKKVIVYRISGHSALELVAGHQSRFFSDSAVFKDSDVVKYTLAPSKAMLSLKNRQIEKPAMGFFHFFDKTILVLRNTFTGDTVKGVLPVDYAVVSGDNHLSVKEIARHFSPECIVLDASVGWWQKEKWKTACKQLNLHCFSVPDQGAWILSLK